MAEEFDAVIVGSGAGGSMAAWVMTKAGLSVAIVEAGRDFDAYGETPMFNWNSDAPLLGSGTPEQPWNYYGSTNGGGWQVPGEPYTTGAGSKFRWFRTRVLGGRANHWARNSFRMGPYDFKGRTRDGLGVDWPISYDDLAPWYDRTEELLGVYGSNTGLENHPDSGPGILHDPPALRVPELMIAAAGKDLGIPVAPARRMILTKDMDERKACFYATHCFRGCSIGAAFQPTTSLLPWAKATGKLTVKTMAMVYEVVTDKAGKATGVRYINRETDEVEEVRGRTVILSASTGETARILMQSVRPGGAPIANGSGQLGRNLADTVGMTMYAQFPMLEGRPTYNEDGAMGIHAYIPFWLYQEQARGELDFARGYHIELGAYGRTEPEINLGGVTSLLDGYGESLKQDMRNKYGSIVGFALRGEKLPSPECYAELDPQKKDKYGLPVLRFSYAHSENEYAMARHFQGTVGSLVDRLGGRILAGNGPAEEALLPGGEVIHEVGTARMGASDEESVVDAFGRVWDVPGLYVMDGSVFASKAHKNPTLTILALTWRNASALCETMRKGDI